MRTFSIETNMAQYLGMDGYCKPEGTFQGCYITRPQSLRDNLAYGAGLWSRM